MATNPVANFKMKKTVKCNVSVSGGKNVKMKFVSQPLGTIVVTLGDKILRMYEVKIGKGETIKVTRI